VSDYIPDKRGQYRLKRGVLAILTLCGGSPIQTNRHRDVVESLHAL